MRVAGIDQSTTITGYSIFEDDKLVDYGRFEAPKKLDPVERINFMKENLDDFLETENIDYVVLEETFLAMFKGKALGVPTYAMLNRNLGVLENLVFTKNIPYSIVYPKTWKSMMNIKGRSRKEQKANTKLRVFEIFGKRTTEDEADAIGLGAYACMAKPWEV